MCVAGGNNHNLCSHRFSSPTSLAEQQQSSSACKAASDGGVGKWGQPRSEQGLVSAGSHTSVCYPATAVLSRASQGPDKTSSRLHTLENFPHGVRTAVK